MNETLLIRSLKVIIDENDCCLVSKCIADIILKRPKMKYLLDYYTKSKDNLLSQYECNIIYHIVKNEIIPDKIRCMGSSSFGFIKSGYYIEITHFCHKGHEIYYEYIDKDTHKAFQLSTKTMSLLATFTCLYKLNPEENSTKRMI